MEIVLVVRRQIRVVGQKQHTLLDGQHDMWSDEISDIQTGLQAQVDISHPGGFPSLGLLVIVSFVEVETVHTDIESDEWTH